MTRMISSIYREEQVTKKIRMKKKRKQFNPCSIYSMRKLISIQSSNIWWTVPCDSLYLT